MEIDYMKGITTSNAHFLELDEVGPDCSVSDEYSWVPPPNRKTIWSEIYNVHLCNKYHFCQICRFGGKLETSYYLGGSKSDPIKWNSLYFRSENRLKRSFIKTYRKAGEHERGQNLWSQLFKNLKKVEEEEETLPKALWTQPLTALTGFAYSTYSTHSTYSTYSAYSAYSAYSTYSSYSAYSPYSPYFTTYASTLDKVSNSARVNSFNVQQGRESVS